MPTHPSFQTLVVTFQSLVGSQFGLCIGYQYCCSQPDSLAVDTIEVDMHIDREKFQGADSMVVDSRLGNRKEGIQQDGDGSEEELLVGHTQHVVRILKGAGVHNRHAFEEDASVVVPLVLRTFGAVKKIRVAAYGENLY